MDLAKMLSPDAPRVARPQQATELTQQEPQRSHQYPTRHSLISNTLPSTYQRLDTSSNPLSLGSNQQNPLNNYDMSHGVSSAPKNVAFELLFDGGNSNRARLPMRVQIFPHDTTDSIVTTVKNFYGLYEGAATGVSFEDGLGNTLIARYENFQNNMIVYVRVVPDYSQVWQPHNQIYRRPASPDGAQRMHRLGDSIQMLPPHPAQILNYGQPISRPSSRIARKKSASPRPGRSRRSVSARKDRPQPSMMSTESSSFQEQLNELNSDATKGYASSDGEGGSVTSSRKAARAEISMDNVVEGNRRKKLKFESSELPLFVPPQVPAANSISSISPQRQSNGHDNASPFARPAQRTFIYNQPLQSPQSYVYGDQAVNLAPQTKSQSTGPVAVPNDRRLRNRANAPSLSTRSSNNIVPRAQGYGILPTPDPTIASCISDEDVALQLMRLGDASNISHGRTSTSTMDETLSGRADVASSVSSEDEDVQHPDQSVLQAASVCAKAHPGPIHPPNTTKRGYKHLIDGHPTTDSTDPSGDEVDGDYLYDDNKDGVFKSDPDDMINEYGQSNKSRQTGGKQRTASKASSVNSSRNPSKISKPKAINTGKKNKISSISAGVKVPAAPAPVPPQSRKTSSASIVNFQNQGEEDLSSKPRCQRCRKSKKGCDRQRPCQRCKDAGIGIEGCISEDEGNGRKGRFGRHMGVSVKKDAQGNASHIETEEAGAILEGMTGAQEKSKKRKR